MTTDQPADYHEGPHGTAVLLDKNPEMVGADTTIVWWLLTGDWHPLWSQFIITVIDLRDQPGKSPAHLQFLDATHELLVLALDPGDPPRVHDKELLNTKGLAGPGYLEPIDVYHQFIATDEEMIQLASACAKGCVNGFLTPSTDDARPALREAWLASCVRTLAHFRGEEHAP